MSRRYYTINLRPGPKFLRLTKSIEVTGPRGTRPRDGWRICFEWTA
jgi:hypothetical protein